MMVNTIDDFSIGRMDMNQYVQNLVNLICEKSNGQVDRFITKVMRTQAVNNGQPPSGKTPGTGRFGELAAMNPTDKTPSADIETTALVSDANSNPPKTINANPKYRANMIDRLKTPFDYIERILLQDFTGVLGIGTKVQVAGRGKREKNYFTDLITFTDTTNAQFKYGQNKIQFNKSSDDPSNLFNYVNGIFNSGEFFVDSFTYTPFIDYSLVGNENNDSRIGIYQDTFLTDYNIGRYEESYKSSGKNEVDKNRLPLSSKLFELRNLEDDLYNAKIAFRDEIHWDYDLNEDGLLDGKNVYIYTFC